MPSAIPSGATDQLPPARMIDPRGHRFGAGVSAILLVVATGTGTPWLVALVLASIGVSAAFGMRWSIYGMVWRRLVRIARLPAVELEHEYPPRFAQVLERTVEVMCVAQHAEHAGSPSTVRRRAFGHRQLSGQRAG